MFSILLFMTEHSFLQRWVNVKLIVKLDPNVITEGQGTIKLIRVNAQQHVKVT